jgi:MoaA/NifB/PqqE/SkfB family radical SAM enzyme
MSKFISLSDIRTIEFGLTTLCNAGCPLCNRHIAGTSTVIPQLQMKSIDVESFRNIAIGLGSQAKNISLSLAGIWGDPMVHPKILDILSIANEYYKDAVVDTNGSMLSEATWIEIAKFKNIKIVFSIDGLEDTNAIYRINTDYNRIINNAKAYINAGGRATWKYIIFKHNEHQVDTAKELAKQLGFWKFKSHYSKRFELPTHNVESAAYKAKINKVKDDIKSNGTTIEPASVVTDQQLLYNQTVDDQTISCKSIEKGYLYISEDSKLWPCCYFESVLPYSQKFQTYWHNIESIYGKDFNSLNNSTVEELLKHEYFTDYLPDSWTDSNKHKCHQCPIKCGESLYRNNIEEQTVL